MDSKRVDHGGARQHHQSSESPTRLSPSPLPPLYSSSFSASDNHTHDNYNYNEKKNKNGVGIGNNAPPRSTSVSPSSQETHRSNNRYSRGDSPVERRRKTRRSRSRSLSSRSHKRSRSRDKDKERESHKEKSRKHSRRDRQSRSRSRSKERRRSRSRSNKSRDKYRFRESRRHHRQTSYESDAAHDEISEPMASQPFIITQPNAFKNDGSFMEMFKKMQEQMQPTIPLSQQQYQSANSLSSASASSTVLQERTAPPPPLMVGKRRGGRILKTGMVAKPKSEPTADQPKDAWSLYMAEVKKYRELIYRSTMPDAITIDQIKTAPYDPRFPNQNQTRYCWQSYVDFHRCSKVRGEDFEACQYFKRVFTSICPNSWIEKWNEQLEEGKFPGRI